MSEAPESPAPDEVDLDDAATDEDSDYAAPFDGKSFGGQFVWASKPGYEAKILRVRAGEKVIVSTRNRKDMVVMLTGGRGLLEVIENGETDKFELEPAAPTDIRPGPDYRLVALTEVELFTVHSPVDEE